MPGFPSPLTRTTSNDGLERSTEGGLVREPCVQCHFRQRAPRVGQELLRSFDAPPDEVVVRRGAKRLAERSREMADRQATFTGEGREPDRSVQMSREQFRRAALLPWRETATVPADGAERRGIGVGYVGAEEQTKVIEEELGERLVRLDGGQDHPGHLMQDWIDFSMGAFEGSYPGRLGIICKHVEQGARYVVMHPVHRTTIARTRIGFQVVDADAPCGPVPDVSVPVVYPDVAPCSAAGVR